MKKIRDQRAQELNDLRLELASFAVRLDAFEAYTKRQRAMAMPEPAELTLSRVQEPSAG